MEYASKDLINEHEGILFGLKILEKMLDNLKAQQPVPQKDLQNMVMFLKLFADKCHHGKEEGLMFPAMEQAGIPKDQGPIGQMLAEHELGRTYIRGMDAASSGATLDVASFSTNARDYIALLRNHIEKENRVLFPLGDRLLPRETQAELLNEFEEFEERVMGAGTHEKLHEMLHEFEGKYLRG